MIEVTEMDGVIRKLINKLEDTDKVGTDDYKAAADTLVKIQKLATEMEQVQQDAIDKAAARERNVKNDVLEHNLKCEQLRDEHQNEVIKHVITIGTTIVTVIVTVWGTKVCLKFEEEGTLTTTVGRSIFNGIFGFFRKK